MSTMSVVNYTSSPHKLNVLQQQSTNNNNNNNNHGNDRREIIILKKQQPILPQPKGYVKDNILITNTAKKKRNGKEPTRTNPQPMAVARRNARERNRVKQVNNGFANLRQHIPNFIAAAFEGSSGRGNNKKLSKVETLRMAVEYIRSLENLLEMDDTSEASENVSTLSLSASSFPSPTPSSPALTTTTNMCYNYPVMSPSIEDDDLSTNPTPPPQQYLRITNLMSSHNMYENSENLQPLHLHNNMLSDTSLVDSGLEFSGVQDLTLLHGIHGNDSLSPEMYSEDSLSPDYIDEDTNNCFISVFNSHSVNGNQLVNSINEDSGVNEDLPLLALKTEPGLGEADEDDMEDVIHWWKQEQPDTNLS